MILMIYIVILILTATISYLALRRLKFQKLGSSLLAGVITIVVIALFGYFAMPYIAADTFAYRIRSENPVVDAIASDQPDKFNAYMGKIRENILSHGDRANEFYLTEDFIANNFPQYVHNASNESLYKYLESELNLDRKLFAINPEYVLYLEYTANFHGKFNPNDLQRQISDADSREILNRKADVIKSAIANKDSTVNIDQTKVKKSVTQIIGDLNTKYGKSTVTESLQNPENPNVDKKGAAEILMDFYQQILDQGQDNAGEILKVLFSLSTESH